MTLYFRGLSSLDLLREFGNLGLHLNVTSLCGKLRITDVGRLIGWKDMASCIQISAPCVTKRKKPYNICWFGVWWLDSSGTPSFIK
jgi:hypothetical protein